MNKAILATKLGMTQIFAEDGSMVPVTVLSAGPCVVTQVKTVERDGYSAIQVGYVDKKERINQKDKGGRREVIHRHGVTRPVMGHLAKAGTTGKRFIREFKFENAADFPLGSEITVDIFTAGDMVDAQTTSKGKGFAGVIKRHGLHRGPSSHGSKFHRHQGSSGAAATPARVFKGKKMPGRMGGEKVTVQNLEVVSVDAEKNLLLIKGSVPGPVKSMVVIKQSVKNPVKSPVKS